MGTLVKLNHHFDRSDNPQLLLNQLLEWQDDLDYWHSECSHFLQLLEWKKLYVISTPNPFRKELRTFAEVEINPLRELIRECSGKLGEDKSQQSIKRYRKLYSSYHQLKAKYRSLKTKVLSHIIKTKASIQIY